VGSSFDLGRVFGIRVGVKWTWLFVVALISLSLATAVLPDQNPELSRGTYWTMGVVAALLFFLSILLHELGHAVQARREGLEVEGITLWLFGGVAQFKGMFRSPGAEFRIAIAGPLVTLVLAAVLVGLAAAASLPPAADGVVFWLGYINLVLLVFNLLPALPLDGGRVLHSALWAAKDDLVWATRIGATIGRGFGYFMAGVGAVLFFAGEVVGGVWLFVLGWFLSSAAAAESSAVVARVALGGLRVRDLMVDEPAVVRPDMTLAQVVDEVVWEERHTTYPVVADGAPVGLLQFARVASVPRSRWEETRVEDCMLAMGEVRTVTQDRQVTDVMDELSGEPGRLLVVDGGRLTGLLSISDVARALSGRGEIGRGLVSGDGRGDDSASGA
jgi:Zn-dependent protease/CBS domain-containing protein